MIVNEQQDVTFRLQISLDKFGFGDEKEFTVTDLWTDSEKTVGVEQLSDYLIVVPRDKSPGGGVRVILVTKK